MNGPELLEPVFEFLDALIAEDPNSRVALETLAKTGLIVLAGEITSKATPDFLKIARKTAVEIGYDSDEVGFNGNMCAVLTAIEPQSPDISQGVTEKQAQKAAESHRATLLSTFTKEPPVVNAPPPRSPASRVRSCASRTGSAASSGSTRPTGRSCTSTTGTGAGARSRSWTCAPARRSARCGT